MQLLTSEDHAAELPLTTQVRSGVPSHPVGQVPGTLVAGPLTKGYAAAPVVASLRRAGQVTSESAPDYNRTLKKKIKYKIKNKNKRDK